MPVDGQGATHFQFPHVPIHHAVRVLFMVRHLVQASLDGNSELRPVTGDGGSRSLATPQYQLLVHPSS